MACKCLTDHVLPKLWEHLAARLCRVSERAALCAMTPAENRQPHHERHDAEHPVKPRHTRLPRSSSAGGIACRSGAAREAANWAASAPPLLAEVPLRERGDERHLDEQPEDGPNRRQLAAFHRSRHHLPRSLLARCCRQCTCRVNPWVDGKQAELPSHAASAGEEALGAGGDGRQLRSPAALRPRCPPPPSLPARCCRQSSTSCRRLAPTRKQSSNI